MNYPYTSIQLIDGDIKAVVNKEVEPKITEPSKITTLIFYFIYDLWQQKHEVFEFANPGEIDEVFYYLTKKLGFKEYETELKQGIEVTCIEIKDGKGWFKDENEDNLKQEFFKRFSTDSFRGYPLEQCHNIWNFFLPHLKSHKNEQNN